ncbi:hypothetical protein G3570_04005 [Balneolaceae bacterium YR4-1]|uniref:BIG2 domain-containing protein n=1 Tax=Halalkalibaculum roseum TaxID=2709311 RepID=A0A6M1SSN6_9BACT|nr:hypothetical protein [Halalkalibaculum roseum]NGP75782.1 hypothetical protein [Halalkalibaculum roseum]
MKKILSTLLALLFICAIQENGYSQEARTGKKIVIEPTNIELKIDQELQLKATVLNDKDEQLEDRVIFYSRARRSLSVTPQGLVKALKPGTFSVVARTVGPRSERISKTIEIKVAYPPIKEITLVDKPQRIYANTNVPLSYRVTDARDLERGNASVSLSSSNPEVAKIDPFGRLQALRPGTTTITAKTGRVSTQWEVEILENPVAAVSIENEVSNIRTGDVVDFNAVAKTASGEVIEDMPLTYSFTSKTDDELGEGASGQIEDDGRFVANKAGLFTIFAKAGNAIAEKTIRVDNRNIQKELQVVGHGLISDVHTSDLWVWEGIDGRDYAITGTWGGNGEAYFWDVTDPSNMAIVDTVTVDARTVNDVKVSEDGRTAVITREGASDRKNGIVILDVTNPRDVKIISEYNNGLTGGVHNAFIYKNHVFAVNNGRRYDIIDINDPKNPETVSRFELDTPGHSIHDVWVENGIAYSSNWSDGIVAVDVGSTPMANSPEKHNVGVGSFKNPVKLGSFTYPSGWNHAAFPFKSKSTDDFYVIAGDEAFPNGLGIDNEPTIPAGWIHFVKFEGGWNSPKEVARYEVPEAGTHNMWVKGDTLYVAYYNAGLRVVDISGELMGNLYDQGREIAKHIPTHHKGRVPNAPMAWGPQPYKGYIFMSDWNSGLWAYKLVEEPRGTN